MKLTTYSLTLGETINLGNYCNFKYEVSGTIDLTVDAPESDEQDIAELTEFLRTKAREIRAKPQPELPEQPEE